MEGDEIMQKLSDKLKHLDSEVNIDDKLYLNRWKPDYESHLVIKDPSCCKNCENMDCTLVCPAKVYVCRDGHITVGYEGCVECGACRIACPHGNIAWRYPRGGYGVQFRLA